MIHCDFFFAPANFHPQDIVIAAAGLHHRDEARRDLGRFGRRTARSDPLLHDALQLVGAFRTVGNSLLHRILNTVAEFLDTEVHTQAELALSSKSEFAHAGPWPLSLVQYGVDVAEPE